MNTQQPNQEFHLFDPLIHCFQQENSYFDPELVEILTQTNQDHQSRVLERCEIDEALRQSRKLINHQKTKFMEYVNSISPVDQKTPTFQRLKDMVVDKIARHEMKYSKVLQKREQLYGPYSVGGEEEAE